MKIDPFKMEGFIFLYILLIIYNYLINNSIRFILGAWHAS